MSGVEMVRVMVLLVSMLAPGMVIRALATAGEEEGADEHGDGVVFVVRKGRYQAMPCSFLRLVEKTLGNGER